MGSLNLCDGTTSVWELFLLVCGVFSLKPWATDLWVLSLTSLESTFTSAGRISCIIAFQFCRDGVLRTEDPAALAFWSPDAILGSCASTKELADRSALVISCPVFPPRNKAFAVVVCLFWQQDGLVSVLSSTHISYAAS